MWLSFLFGHKSIITRCSLVSVSVSLSKTYIVLPSTKATLNEKQKRLFAGLKASELGYFGVRQVAEEFGLHPHTIRAGQKELAAVVPDPLACARMRKSGGGRKKSYHRSRLKHAL